MTRRGTGAGVVWVSGYFASVTLFIVAIASVGALAFSSWGAWGTIVTLALWPVSIVVGPIVAALMGVWEPAIFLALAALAYGLSWFLTLLLGWS